MLSLKMSFDKNPALYDFLNLLATDRSQPRKFLPTARAFKITLGAILDYPIGLAFNQGTICALPVFVQKRVALVAVNFYYIAISVAVDTHRVIHRVKVHW